MTAPTRRLLTIAALSLPLLRCASAANTTNPSTADNNVRAQATAGSEADGMVARAALGLNFRLPSNWRSAGNDRFGGSQWAGPDNTVFVVTGDPAADAAAHTANVQAFRARAAQSRWTLENERPAPSMGADAVGLEIQIPAQFAVMHLPSWVGIVNNRLAVLSCVYETNNSAVGAPACATILGSVGRQPRAGAVPEGSRAVSIGAVSALVPADWTDAHQGDVRAYASREEGDRQIALTMALSPEGERVTSVNPDEIRQRFTAQGGRAGAPTARALGGIAGFAFDVEQPQLRQAPVTELALMLWHQSRSLVALCGFRSDDNGGRATCGRVMATVQRAQ